jgi:extradiol dioxygenase family protein
VDTSQQGARHFGVVLPSLSEFKDLVARIDTTGYQWISEPEQHSDAELSGKLGGKLADPSGNIIEIKYYENENDYLS